MPQNLDECVQQVKAQGHDESSAFAICNAAINKEDKPTGCADELWKEITASDLPGNPLDQEEMSKSDKPEPLNVFIPITKVDLEKREVWGYLTVEEADNAREIMDYDTSKPYFLEWSNQSQKRSGGKSKGNLRAMHQAIAAGKLISLQADDARKGIYIGANVIDDTEWNKCVEGVYTGFSVGGNYIQRWPDRQRPGFIRYTGKPSEASLVDAPCVNSAVFDVVKGEQTEQRLFKADGTGEQKLVLGETPVQSYTLSSAGNDFTLTYDGNAITVKMLKANDALVPPATIETPIITRQLVTQQVEYVQNKNYPLELNSTEVPNGGTLAQAGNAVVNMESTVAPIVPVNPRVDNKVATIAKIKVIRKTIKVMR